MVFRERVRRHGGGNVCEFRGNVGYIWRFTRDYPGVSDLGDSGWILVWMGIFERWARKRDVYALFLRFHRFRVYYFVVGKTKTAVVVVVERGGERIVGM